MKRCIVLLLSALCLFIVASAQTYYYQLTAISQSNIRHNIGRTGIFVTFTKTCCYVSDRNGNTDNSGILQYKCGNSKITDYYGQSHWGVCHFYVSGDRNLINISDGNKTYIYTRTSPGNAIASTFYGNTGNTGSQNQQNGAGFMPMPYPSNSSPSNSNSSRSSKKLCPVCHGSGKYGEEIVYRPDFTGNQANVYCPVCGRTTSPHSHRDKMCRTCMGRGYLDF